MSTLLLDPRRSFPSPALAAAPVGGVGTPFVFDVLDRGAWELRTSGAVLWTAGKGVTDEALVATPESPARFLVERDGQRIAVASIEGSCRVTITRLRLVGDDELEELEAAACPR